MFNFLPQNNKRIIIREYIYRLSVVFLSALLILVFISILLLLPSFIISKNKSYITTNNLLEMTKKDLDIPEDLIIYIKNTNLLSDVLSDRKQLGNEYSNVIDKIIFYKTKDISILSVTVFDEKISKDTKVIINGVAKSREALSMFESNLKNDGYFENVNIPVSSFLKSTNSDFSVTLIL